MPEITDQGIILAALDNYAVELWHEIEAGQRCFGTTVHADIVQRIMEIKTEVKLDGCPPGHYVGCPHDL